MQLGCLMYDCLNGQAPEHYKTMFSTLSANEDRPRTRQQVNNPHNISNQISTFGPVANISFPIKGPAYWNTIPQDIKSQPSKDLFRSHLKKHILNSYSQDIQCNNPNCTDFYCHQP